MSRRPLQVWLVSNFRRSLRRSVAPRVSQTCPQHSCPARHGAALRSRPYRGHWRWVGPTSPPTFNPAYSPGLFATFGRV
ncbi:hypothetical protein M885DRAFT_624118 [Pelagophyceae sp. CCMP2097]|nr:hypothetical protein M885DRAFT_624118 [Pelagophyceae sp. CCMP2097]